MTGLVTNGHWVGTVISSHGKWSWVVPHHRVDKGEDGEYLPYSFDDGPLTFETSSLREFK